MPRGTQSSQRKSKAMPQLNWKTGYPSKFEKKKKTKKQKPPTHSSTEVSYDIFLEQMAQRKIQTNFVICSDMSIKNWHTTVT